MPQPLVVLNQKPGKHQLRISKTTTQREDCPAGSKEHFWHVHLDGEDITSELCLRVNAFQEEVVHAALLAFSRLKRRH
ncbi:hypothetical protein [Deinococcus hopiensis]|uniref:hypothetical protein n=1 Tax=Deinococcus hopiensis TaxID=309885 RepID=UPI00111C748C|nr:hypothetical protein [Deinococcus hopiensis]